MAQNEIQKGLSQFIKSQFLKRTVTKLVLSVSVLFSLSFSLSQSTLLSFVHHFNFYFSTLPFKLLSHNLDKNYTFLLFNGLLVFLAGLFSLSPPPPSSNKFNLTESFKNYEDDLQPQVTIMETTHHQVPLLEQEAELEITETQEEQNAMQQENEIKKSDQVDKTETEMFTEEKQEEQEEKAEEISEAEAESSFFIEEVDDEEAEEGGGNEKLSDEELNKKFDDFIRKMKEELRIEARQQLITV